MEPFLGQIMLVPYNFAPRGWAFCDGSLLPINQYTALFALLGTMYGGDGRTTFALPDLRGRVPVSSGQGPGLQSYPLGEAAGSESVTLVTAQIPAHIHMVQAATSASAPDPAGHFPGTDGLTNIYDATAGATMNPQMIGPAGGNQAHENRQPFLVMNYIIALEGIFPSRS